jgi:hypothetical protein
MPRNHFFISQITSSFPALAGGSLPTQFGLETCQAVIFGKFDACIVTERREWGFKFSTRSALTTHCRDLR